MAGAKSSRRAGEARTPFGRQRKRRLGPLALVALGAIALVLVTGCGKKSASSTSASATTTTVATTTTGPPLAKAEYVTKMKAIGQSLSTSLNTLGSATTAKKAAVALAAVQVDLRDAADRIDAISAPEAITKLHSQLAKAVRDFADELDPVITKLKAGNMSALSSVPTLKGLTEIQTASTAISNKGYKIGG